jgi:hypothetical protein
MRTVDMSVSLFFVSKKNGGGHTNIDASATEFTEFFDGVDIRS